MYWAYRSGFLPLPKRLTRHREYRTEISEIKTFDFHPVPGDEATIHAVWVADLITPAKLDGSMKKMRRVNWKDSISANEKIDNWMESTRRINSGSWRNLGAVARTKNGFYSVTVLPDLPEIFEYANFQVISITSSLSAVIGCFYFTDLYKSKYNEIAKLHLYPDGTPNKNGSISINYPRFIKQKRVRSEREKWQFQLSKFMSTRFGTFLSSHDPDHLPIIDFVEFSKNTSNGMYNFVTGHADEWRSDETIVCWASFSGDHRPSGHSTVYFYTEDLPKEDLSMYGGSDATALISRLTLSIGSNWAFEAIHSLLLHYERLLSAARDKSFQPIASLRSRRRFFEAEQAIEIADIQLVTDELRDENLCWLASNMVGFERNEFQDTKTNLQNVLPQNIQRRAKDVSDRRSNIVAAKKSLNDAYSTFQMAKLTTFSFYVALFSSFISLVALLVASLSITEVRDTLLPALGWEENRALEEKPSSHSPAPVAGDTSTPNQTR